MRKLYADEIECRVAQVKANGCSLLLYKTARVDRAILDETFGPMNWQNDFKVIDGKMYGYVSVWDKEKNQWITKADCGVESFAEAEKGEASDCFKRGCFKWGIGVELYSAPFIWLSVPTQSVNGKYQLVDKYIKFSVEKIGYSEKGNINDLIISDDKGNIVFKMNSKKKPKTVKGTITNDDIEIYINLTHINDVETLTSYYEANKYNVNNQKQFHSLIVERQKAIKQIKS